ncbi:MAG: hypothetical protein GY903_07180 [Fuerstiella sp.]|nr:hypothetical protein [Fuerstiella sp.]MCP4854259.1 hypothetical protein [Fuerstiella sp.]
MDRRNVELNSRQLKPATFSCLVGVCLWFCVSGAGCYAPLHSHGTSASILSDEFRWPSRTAATPLNYSSLVGPVPAVYLLGAGDRLDVTVADLIVNGNVQTFQVQVLDNGEIHLPRSGPIVVGGMTLAQAQQEVNEVLTNGLLQKPGAIITLTEKGTVNVLVLGAVQQPGVHALPRYENDVAHALAAAQGFAEDAGDVIEIHRRTEAMIPAPGVPIAEPETFPATSLSVPTPLSIPTPLSVPPRTSSTSFPQHRPIGLSNESPGTTLPTETKSPPRRPYANYGRYVGPVSFSAPASQENTHLLPGYSSPAPVQTQPSQLTPNTLPRFRTQLPFRLPEVQKRSRTPSRFSGHAGAPLIRGQSPSVIDGHPPSVIDSNPQSVIEGIPASHMIQFQAAPAITSIPLRGARGLVNPADMVLNAGDVLVVPQKTDKVFYVVGPLSEQNSVRFSVNDKDREIGGGLLLPDDREIDVVTAVVMAGYIDPINSPTTVTLHRVRPGGLPLLVRIDLIAARHDPRENILVEPGDIIYLNPDPWWYLRRTFDLVIDRGLGTAFGRWLSE